MKHIAVRGEMRTLSRAWQRRGERVGLVPTMGNLHRGHLELVDRLSAAVDRLVVSIFVNPLQFGPGEDYDAYPRTLAADLDALRGYPVDAVFAPSAEEMYPHGESWTQIDIPALTTTLCGVDRPGHFAGVAVVVAKLLHVVAPDQAIFGCKDYQQLLVIRRLAADLDWPTQIVALPTVREVDGLALSSRNAYLGAAERRIAPHLYATLCGLADALRSGRRDFDGLEAEGERALLDAGFDRVDYVAIRRPDDLGSPNVEAGEWICLAATHLGGARLIDNLVVTTT